MRYLDSITLKITKLPVWENTYHLPNKGRCENFQLTFNEKLGLIQQKDIFYTNYQDVNYNFITNPPGYSEYSNSQGDCYINRIIKLLDNKKFLQVLEIGAGSSYVAQGLKPAIDYQLCTLLDPALIDEDLDKIRIINDYFPCAKVGNQKFDLIYSINTLEHIINPGEFLINLRENITEQSMLLFIFPDIENQFKIGDLGALIHEHINYFSYKSACKLFQLCGFYIENIIKANDEITVLCRKNEEQNISNEINCNAPLINILETTRLMESKLDFNKKLVEQKLSEGKNVAFHGACNALSNFLYISQLNQRNDYYIFDGDKSKQNRYLPFSSVPILFCNDPKYNEIDYLFIASSTFSTQIRAHAVSKLRNEFVIDLFA